MAKKKTKKQVIDQFKNEAKSSDWDDLAFGIINIERLVAVEKDSKMLKLLKIRLEIFEAEKMSRVSDSFDMEYFMSKEFQHISEDDLDFSDI